MASGKAKAPAAEAPAPDQAPRAWRVVGPLQHDGVSYAPGATIELADAASAALVAVGAVAATEPGA